jgi:ribosomal protein S18 acetylase RimI-like enzyme
MKTTLRPAGADDEDFLFTLYASTRLHEIAAFGWPAAQQEVFLRMQFMAQQRGYESNYPQAEHQIVELNGTPVGRLMVYREKDSVRLVDIALLAEHRAQGIGAELIGVLIEQCARAGATLRLQVLQTNPALRLYERLGFTRTGEDAMYIEMEQRPS